MRILTEYKLDYQACINHIMTEDELKERLQHYPDWQIENKYITKNFQFADDLQALSFVHAVLLQAHGINHHPDLRVVYNKVELRYFTHDKQAITKMDFIAIGLVEQLCL